MREIKFRAWEQDFKKMYWFDLRWGNTWQEGAGYIGMVPWGEKLEHRGFCRDNKSLVSPNFCEIMQYTGLKDKNGKEIYEGDIVINLELPCSESFICEWCSESIAFIFWNEETATGLGEAAYNGLEIIGNIYENPELHSLFTN